MNILVLCHHYKKHDILTLINGKTANDYIYLTPENIHNISLLTNGVIEKISFVDPNPEFYAEEDQDPNLGIIQYQDANKLPNKPFDAIYTIHCPPSVDVEREYGSKLTSSGKIIDVDHDYSKKRVTYGEDEDLFPFFVKPLELGHEKYFGATIHKLTIEGEPNARYVSVNRDFLPKMDEHGNLTIPQKGGYKRRIKVSRKFLKSKKRNKKTNKHKKNLINQEKDKQQFY
jgi:hypothetical protein